MSHHRSILDVLGVALLLGVVHCGQAREEAGPAAAATPPADNLGGTSWRLVKFQGGDETILTPDDPAKYTITFQPDGRVSARIDCNRGMGSWRSPGPPQLELGPLALTRMMCPEGSLHDQIARQWTYVRSYMIRDGHLFLSLMADGGIYELEPVSQEGGTGGTPSLENTDWKLVRLGEAPIGATPSEPHLRLDPATSRATGSGGCNQMGGEYTLDGDRLTLGRMVSTMMACAEGMETERAFLDALGRVRGWRLAGEELELLDAAGAVLARLEPR
jgi:heat shock protein HslJ